jgi:histone H1/5
MKRFKRPISEIAKGMFHGGADGPIIPNLGVNSKKAESSSPAKIMPSPRMVDKIDKPTQSQKNAEARKAGKAVSYEDAYADADMKKYGGKDGKARFIADAKKYNKEKYNTENPTADSKKAGKTKAQLAKDVAAKKSETKPAAETTKKVEATPKAEVKKTKAEKITTKGDAKVEKIKARKAKRAERKAGRVEKRAARKEARADNRAARKEARAKVKAARKGESTAAPGKYSKTKK